MEKELTTEKGNAIIHAFNGLGFMPVEEHNGNPVGRTYQEKCLSIDECQKICDDINRAYHNSKKVAWPCGATKEWFAVELKYHSSWDWLRPVFDKWLQLPNHSNDSVQALIDNYTARIAHKLAYESCESAAKSMAIAITWYNKNKPI